MLQPTFSIITITYNAVRLVEQTLLNVLSQSYPNIEYIVIDGGSTDGTVDIIKRYESGLAYWVSEPDKGIYDAMNKGLQKATGDYVWFINAASNNGVDEAVSFIFCKCLFMVLVLFLFTKVFKLAASASSSNIVKHNPVLS